MGGDGAAMGGGERVARVAAVAVVLLALVATAEVVGLTTLYDFRFGLASLGVVAAGVGGGVALGPWLRRRFAEGGVGFALVLAALAVVVTLIAHLLLPSGPSLVALLPLLLPSLPAGGVGAAIAISLEGADRRSLWHLPLALFAGLVVATVVTQYAGGPRVATAAAGAGLALLGWAMAPAGVARRLAQGVLVALVLTVLASGYRLSPTPGWVAGHGAKPFYRDLATGEARRLATRWQGVSRLDLASARWSGDRLLWPAIDGNFLLPAAVADTAGGERAWLQRNFPLLTLALQAARPARLLVAAPGGGLAVYLALDAGVRRIEVVEPSPLARRAIAATRGRHGDLFRRAGVTLSPSTLPAYLARQTDPYDAILLTVPVEEGGWRGRDPAAGAPFTREALAACWRHLAPGGSLIVVAGDSALFGRTLLTAWAAWAEVAGKALPLTDHAAGVRRLSLSARVPLLQYLALIRRDGEATDLGARLESALGAARQRGLPPDTSLATLFGPGVRAKAPYPALAASDPEAALPPLFQSLSWRAQTALDLRPVTADRPLFFQVVGDLPGALKVLLLVALAALAAVLMLALAAVRRVDHPAAAALPPLPLLLAASGLAAALPAAGVGALCLLAALAAGGLGLPLAAAVAGGCAGAVAGGGGARPKGWPVWAAAALLFDLMVTGWGWVGGVRLMALPPGVAVAGVAVVAAVAAFLARRQLGAGRSAMCASLPGLGRWSPVVVGLALLIAALAAPWTVQGQGITTVWIAAAGGQVVIVVTGLWLHRLGVAHRSAPHPDPLPR